MTNHSSERDPLIDSLKGDIADMKRQHLQEAIGATGRHPEGKITPQDEGELVFAITNTMGKVVLNFGKPVAWVGFRPRDARQLAELLLRHAAHAEIIGAARSEETMTAKVLDPTP